jgi:methyl-accepting chemotaxis protein
MAAIPKQTLEGVTQLMGQAFNSLVDDLGRARGLLRDAIPGLVTSFNGLRTELRSQQVALTAVSEQLQGGANGPGFLARMGTVVDQFVSDLVTVSHGSMQLVERVELLGTEVDSIVGYVARIESLAKETRFVALNARIEAHRSGDAGKTFRVVADEVKALADDAGAFSGQIRDVVQRCHERLAEARTSVGSLASHDMTGALEAQRAVMSTVARLDESNGRVVDTLKLIDEHIDASIRALQFEDILSQLLTSVQGRMGLLRDLWLQWLSAQGAGSDEGWGRLEASLAELSTQLKKPQAVNQDSMAAGTTELF